MWVEGLGREDGGYGGDDGDDDLFGEWLGSPLSLFIRAANGW